MSRRPPASAPSATCSTRRPSTRTSSRCRRRSCATRELEKLRQVDSSVFEAHTLDITWPVARGPGGHGSARSERVCAEADAALADGVNILILSDRGVERGARADPVAARGRGRAPPPGPRGHAPAGRPRARDRRAARGAPLRAADRLRRERDQPVPGVRDARRAGRRGPRATASTTSTRREKNVVKGDRQGPAQDDLQDGHLDDPVLLRARRSSRPSAWPRSSIDAHFTGTASRIGGVGLDVLARRGARAPRARRSRRPDERPAAGRRRLRVAPRRRAPHVEPGDDRAAAARRPPRRRGRPSRSTRSSSTRTRRGAPRCAGC